MKLSDLKTVDQVIEERKQTDPDFAVAWDRAAYARQVAAAVINYRNERSITQQQLAEETGLDPSTIAQLEIGETTPAPITVARLDLLKTVRP